MRPRRLWKLAEYRIFHPLNHKNFLRVPDNPRRPQALKELWRLWASRQKPFARQILQGSVPAASEECQEVTPDGTVRCRAGRATFWVTWHGEMRPCGMMERPGVSVRNRKFSEVWKKLTELTGQIRLSGVCSRCDSQKICHVCAAMALAETGEFEKTPGYLCRMVNALRKEASFRLNL